MRDLVRHYFWILAAASLVLFTNLGVPALWDDDEPKNAECAREMLARSDWVVPRFNYQLRTDKPVLLYWFMIAAYQTFGVNEFAARFSSAVFACGSCLLTYHLGRTLFRPSVGLWAGVILASALMFDVAGRAATPDSLLIFFTTLALYLFARRVIVRQECGAPVRAVDYLPAYASMGMAVLAKGPVGILLPALVMIVYQRCRSEAQAPARTTPDSRSWQRQLLAWIRYWIAPRPWLATIRTMHPLTAIWVIALVALPWYVWVGIRTDGAWLSGFIGRHNVQRFVQPMENHRGPFFYYFLAIMLGFLPWSVFLPQALLRLGRRLASGTWHSADMFAACWAAVYLGFFTMAATKLPSYVLPAYPALALLTACLIDQWVRDPESVSRRWIWEAIKGLFAVGVVMAIALPIVTNALLRSERWVGVVGIVPALGAIAAYFIWTRRGAHAAAVTFAVTAVVMVTTLFGAASISISRHSNSPAMAATLKRLGREKAPLATYQHGTPSLTYYTRHRVRNLWLQDQVARHFLRSPDACLIVRAKALKELRMQLPGDVCVLARERQFLRSGDLLLLGRDPRAVQTANHRVSFDTR